MGTATNPQVASTVGELPSWDTLIDLETRTVDIEQFFLQNRDLPGCIIRENANIYGILSRKNLMVALSKPFGRDVFIKRPVGQLMATIDTKPLVLPAETMIAAALKQVMSRADEQRYEPVLVDCGDASPRLLEVNVLMVAQASLLEQALCAKDELIEEVRRTASELRTTLDEQQRLARELATANEVAQYQATHDSLTGLPNRRLFLEELEQALIRNRLDPVQDCAVLFIDLDRFKIVNDSLGHLAGNELLKEVARRLSLQVRKHAGAGNTRFSDMVARLSGDEFTVLLTGKERPADAEALAARLQTALEEPFSIGAEIAYISASIGIVASLTGYIDTEAVLRDSDIAMYRAKNLGKARAIMFEPSMHEQAETRLHMENDLRHALAKHEFELYYQPTVELPSRAIAGLEALLCWHAPAGLIEAADFIGLAEETGLILPLGEWIFSEVCKTVRHWHGTLPDPASVNISINLPARQFFEEELAEFLQRAILCWNVNPAAITLEVAEHCIMTDPDQSRLLLKRFKAIGVRLCISDFGAGYSCLGQLHALPIDVLKIHPSFTENLSAESNNKKIFSAILGLAESLGISTVVAGVETVGQLEFLERLGCKFAQGPLFAKSLSLGEAESLLRDTAAFAGHPNDRSSMKFVPDFQ
jgi:diguanylate cyclase (GGDEF)-like protein